MLNKLRKFALLVAPTVLMAFGALAIHAQTTATIRGTVTDPSAALVPGATRTEMFSRWLEIPGVEESILSGQPNGRFAEPIELAKAALYLASDDASFVTGHAMVVDGGAALP